MGLHKLKPEFTLHNDVWVNYEEMMNKIGDPDPETGCQYQLYGGKHKQGYMMVTALIIDPLGHRTDPHGNPIKTIMTTGHRVLARIKYNCSLTPKQKVYHTCGNMACLNSDHLAIGDYKDITGVFKTLGKSRGPVAGAKRKVKVQKRSYKYSIPELLIVKHATSKQEICEKLGVSKGEAHNLKVYMNQGRYAWLAEYDPLVTKTPKEIIDITKK